MTDPPVTLCVPGKQAAPRPPCIALYIEGRPEPENGRFAIAFIGSKPPIELSA
ncbi:hypothetical protein PMm318_A54960 [Pseudomonas moorei]